MNGVAPSFDRAAYFSQFGLNTYSDYVTHNAAITSSRVQNYAAAADPHVPQSAFPTSFPTGGGGLSGGYPHWGDGRPPTTVLADPYSQYGGPHGVPSSYDSYKNAALSLRGSVYAGQEAALGFNAAARGYFSARASDTYQGECWFTCVLSTFLNRNNDDDDDDDDDDDYDVQLQTYNFFCSFLNK